MEKNITELSDQLKQLFGNLDILLDNQKHKAALDESIVQNQSMIIKNLEVIVKNQINIIENQKYIVENQITLGVILETQIKTLHAVKLLSDQSASIEEIKKEIQQIRSEKAKDFSTNRLNNPTLI